MFDSINLADRAMAATPLYASSPLSNQSQVNILSGIGRQLLPHHAQDDRHQFAAQLQYGALDAIGPIDDRNDHLVPSVHWARILAHTEGL